jgi:hypothetical protein
MIPSFLLKEALIDRHTYYVGWDNMCFVGQTIEQRCRHPLIGKDRVPVGKAQVRGHDDGHSFIEIRAELKEQLAPIFAEWFPSLVVSAQVYHLSLFK